MDPVKCHICKKKLEKSYLRRHLIRSHGVRKKASNIMCCACKMEYPNRESFRDHVNEQHAKINTYSNEMSCWEDFCSWLSQEEKANRVHFVRSSSPRKLINGNIRLYYFCQYDNGVKKKLIPNENRRRALRFKGSYKLTGCCPAQIIVEKCTDGRVTFTYFSTHIGHTNDITHFWLGVRDTKKLSVDFDMIMWKRDPDDATSVRHWIDFLSEPEFNAVRFLKMQGADHPEAGLQKDDFVLVIITEIQLELLKEFGNRIVCVDSTYDTNQCKFILTTIILVDEREEVMPGAFLLSSRMDRAILEIFFEAVRDSVRQCLTPAIFMSDDFPVYYNTWIHVMKPSIKPKEWICAWYIDKRWRKRLSRIGAKKGKVPEKQAAVYRMLRLLLEETNTDAFVSLLGSVMTDLMSDVATVHFGHYFKKQYISRIPKWAYCYRVAAGMNTDAKIETLHRLLKTSFVKGLKMNRLDFLIHLLLKIIRDKQYDRMTKLQNAATSRILLQMNKSHRKGVDISDDHVQEKEKHYLVKSQIADNLVYKVKKVSENCNCNLICRQCNACVHLYACDCEEYVIKCYMCQHIHKVSHFVKSRQAAAEAAVLVPSDNAVKTVVPSKYCLICKKKAELKQEEDDLLKEAKELSECLLKQLNERKFTASQLRKCNEALKKIETIFAPNDAPKTESPSFNKKDVHQRGLWSIDECAPDDKTQIKHLVLEEEVEEIIVSSCFNHIY